MIKSLCVRREATITISAILLVPAVWPLESARADEASDTALQEVTVTARRQAESALKVPESMTVFDSSTLERLDVQDFNDMASKVSNLSIAWGAGGGGNGASLGYAGARTIAIRGIAGGGTTGFYIDDTPVPATINPEVMDVSRIEVLKGPQGTLYGEGSMGGNVRYVTNQPVFTPDFRITASGGYTDHADTPDGRALFMGNLPLVDGVVAARVVGFVNHDGGFIVRQFPASPGGELKSENNQGAVTDYGGSISVLIKPTDKFSILPRFLAQTTEGHGLGDAFAPLPQFDVDSYTLVRAADVQENWTDKWYLPSLELKYSGDSWDLVSSTSYFHRYLYQIEDGTEGTTQVLAGPPYNAPPSVWQGGVAWPQRQVNSNVYQELRAVWAGNQHVRAIFGGFYSNQVQDWENGSTTFNFPGLVDTGTFSSPLLWDQPINSRLLDRSLYGEVYFTARGFELTLGGREFWLDEHFQSSNNGFLSGGYVAGPPLQSSQNGFNPKVSLSYTVSNDTLVYATAAKGFRAGGPNTPLNASCDPGLAELGLTASQLAQYNSDSLWNYEVGAKSRVGSFTLTGALFEMKWDQIQQNLAIPVCFLPVTTNAGAARIRGVEFEAVGRPLQGLEFQLGVGYQDPRITEAGLSPQLTEGSRIQQIPFVTFSTAITYTHPLTSSLEGFVSTDYSYTGDSVSGTTTSLFGEPPVVRAGYGLWNARLGATWDNNKRLFLYLKNITNTKANLGDVNPIAFPQSDPATGLLVPRVAVARPLQIGLQFSYNLRK